MKINRDRTHQVDEANPKIAVCGAIRPAGVCGRFINAER